MPRRHIAPVAVATSLSVALSGLVVGPASAADRDGPGAPEQIAVGNIARFPAPSPHATLDWKQRAIDYDSFVYDWTDRGVFSTIRADTNALNMPAGSTTYSMPAYYGDTRTATGAGSQEAVTQIASVVGASLVGIDKSDQDGRDYVDMLRTFFHPDLGIARNTPSSASTAPGSKSAWYWSTANVLYSMLGALYPDATDMDTMQRSIADTLYGMVVDLGGAQADFTMQDFDFATDTRVTGRNEGGDAAAGAAAVLLWAYGRFGDTRYLQGAQWSMDFLQRSSSNLYYEVLPVLAPYLAARLNAQAGTSYDVSKYLDWLQSDSKSRKGWGTMLGAWGDHDVSGLSGSRSDSNGYAFAMNSFATPLLAATAKYDVRYADAIGRWLANVDNAARFFYADQMPPDAQLYGTTYADDPAHVIAYEGIRHQGTAGLTAMGDIPDRSGNWGLNAEATSLGLYGSSWVGMMGSTLAPTDDPDVVRVDLDALDFYGENTYPTYLYFNSGSQDATVSLPVEGTHDVYDAISDRIVTDDATVSAPVDVPAGHAAVVVVVPGDSALVHEGNVTKVNGHAVGYATSQGRDLALGRVATASQGPSAAVVDDSRLTSWSATTGASVVVDLATTRTVNEVTASWGARPAARWTVDTSVDGTSWSQAADVAGAAGAQTTTFTPRAARLVRLKLTDAEPTADLASLEVRQRNLAIGAPVTVSTTANDVHRPEGVTDGSTATRWESATADPQWVTVDLGSSRPVGDVVVRWEAAAAKSYLVQVSQDGSAWTTASTVEGTGGDQTTALPEGTTARYVRVYGTSRLTKYAYSLWELEVYGAIGTATVAPSATETTLSVMPSSVPVGAGATATARVTVPGADVPGGRVDLLADGRTVTSAPTGPNGEVQLTVPASLSVGSHVLRAVFVPSDAVTWASSTSAAVAFSVRASGVSSLSSIRVGGTALAGFTPTKHTYTLTLPAGTTKAPTVTVTTTDPGAKATITNPTRLPGTTTITVTAPDTTRTTYTLAFTLKAPATTTIKATTTTTTYGKAAKITATLTAGTTRPTGKLTATENGKTLATTTVTTGRTTLTLPTTLKVATHKITLTFTPTTTTTTSAKTTIKVKVTKTHPKLAKITTSKKLIKGHKATIKISLRPTAGAKPTGKITITAGGTKIGTATLKKTGTTWTATITTHKLPTTGKITATYTGNTTYTRTTWTTTHKITKK